MKRGLSRRAKGRDACPAAGLGGWFLGYGLNLETAATYRRLFWPDEFYRYQIRRQDLGRTFVA